ncbi:MAG TPA: MFS transporter [Opitutaceae bacterium]|nr:MFS transporter [Opitutaceae bacterium]HND61437.1 MFS transporter [Opitutaceae bacterium]
MTNGEKPLWPVATLVVLTGLNLLDYLDRQLLAAVLPALQADLRLGDEQAGTIATAFMLGYFLTAPVFGWLGDRVARTWLIAGGVFVWSLGTLLSGHTSAFVSLLFFRVLVGFGEASFGTISPGWIADLFPSWRRNNAITVFYLAIPVGSALGYLMGGFMAVHFGWRSAFLWAGYPGLLLAFLLFLLREPERGASDRQEGYPAPVAAVTTEPVGWRVYLDLFRYRGYVLVVAGYVAQTFAMGGFSLWAPSFLHRIHHLPLDRAAFFFSASLAATGLFATLIGGFWATRWQRRSGSGYAWLLALSASLAAPLSFLAFTIDDLAWAKVALVGTMFLLFFSTGPVNTLILETVPVTMRASAMAASIFSIHLFGDLWSPKFVGYLSDRWGDLRQAVLCALPGALIVSAVCWGLLVAHVRRQRDGTG